MVIYRFAELNIKLIVLTQFDKNYWLIKVLLGGLK